MLLSDEFVDPLVAKGAALSWHFLYMPVGGAPDTTLMPTPEQRNQIRLGIQRLRNTKAMFPVDFWGDAPYVKGCIAGKHYIHINNEGWVEPCIFTHFATDNVNDVSLKEAFSSAFFQEIRRRQPFNHNLLMPCMLIDNPHHSREIIEQTGAHPKRHPAGGSSPEEAKDPDAKHQLLADGRDDERQSDQKAEQGRRFASEDQIDDFLPLGRQAHGLQQPFPKQPGASGQGHQREKGQQAAAQRLLHPIDRNRRIGPDGRRSIPASPGAGPEPCNRGSKMKHRSGEQQRERVALRLAVQKRANREAKQQLSNNPDREHEPAEK